MQQTLGLTNGKDLYCYKFVVTMKVAKTIINVSGNNLRLVRR